MKFSGPIVAGMASCAALFPCLTAQAGSTFYYNANQSYRSAANSPFQGQTDHLYLERFEDGLLNTAGVTSDGGFVQGPGSMTDSVDKDQGPIDGFGRQGHSFSSGNRTWITFRFANQGGKMPTMAGLVWTDGHANSTITFRAWDAMGNFIGKIRMNLGDAMRNGGTAEDRFLGVKSTNGISKIQIASNYAGFEVDHLQFAYGFAVVPVPPALALGAVGLVGVAIRRRKKSRTRS